MSKTQRNIICLKTISMPVNPFCCLLPASNVVRGKYSTMLVVWSRIKAMPTNPKKPLILPSNQSRFPCGSTHCHTTFDSESSVFSLQTSTTSFPSSLPNDDLASFFTEKTEAKKRLPQSSTSIPAYLLTTVCTLLSSAMV